MEPVNPIKHFGGKETTENIQQEEATRQEDIQQEEAERDRVTNENKQAQSLKSNLYTR